MNYLLKKLKEFGDINVSIVGAGLMGKSIFAQLIKMENFNPMCLASRNINKVVEFLDEMEVDYEVCDKVSKAQDAVKKGKVVATDVNEIAAALNVHAVVDATGNIEAGAKLSLDAIKYGRDIVSLNVEMDVTCGIEIAKRAREKGLIYTGISGDEPGAIRELYEFANFVDLEVLALGKGKNNPLNVYATVEELTEEAISKKLSPRMLTSFVDGTNTMIELNAIANSTGFVPDVRGCHNISADTKTLPSILSLKEEGGILNSYKVVDFVRGIAPGVFAVVRAKSESMDYDMRFLKMGEGPNYLLYRPYHLTSIEVPISIAKAVLLRDSSIVSSYDTPAAETICVAKRDILPGEKIEGIGGNSIYGTLEKYSIKKSEDLVPIGFINENAVAKRHIKKGMCLTSNDVALDENSVVIGLRKPFD